MPYMSTRGAEAISAPEAIVRGIAPDGGLYAPLSLPGLKKEDFASVEDGIRCELQKIAESET